MIKLRIGKSRPFRPPRMKQLAAVILNMKKKQGLWAVSEAKYNPLLPFAIAEWKKHYRKSSMVMRFHKVRRA